MWHLFHPAFVHFSVAFLVVGSAVEAWGQFAGREAATRWGSSILIVGLLSLVPTIATGYLAANTVVLPAGGAERLASHELNGWILLALAFAGQFWKAWCGGRIPDGQRRLYALLLLAVVGLCLYSAWLGGQMVYSQGIGVR